MKIITKNRIIDFESFKTSGDKEYNFNKKCSLCGRPYVKNTLLPDDMINILGDKIKYIPSCNCHIEIFEKNLESINRKTKNERIINRGKKYKDFSVIDDRFLNSVFEKGDEKVFLLIDTRYRTGKPVIISTNLEYKNDENLCEIQKVFGRRIKDRINEMCFPIFFDGKSRRNSPADKFQKLFINT